MEIIDDIQNDNKIDSLFTVVSQIAVSMIPWHSRKEEPTGRPICKRFQGEITQVINYFFLSITPSD